jgi:hypothetical protein
MQRYYLALWSITKRQAKDLENTVFILDEHGRLKNIEFKKFQPTFTFNSPYISDELSMRIASMSNLLVNIDVKKFPMRSLTMSGLRAYLDNLEVAYNFIPDMLILDYIGIMQTDAKNHRISLGRTFEEFKGLCEERQCAGVTAHQVSRIGATAHRVSTTHVAEDWSLIATADIALTFSQSKDEEKFNLARLYVDKARSDLGKFGCIITQNYQIGKFCQESHLLGNTYFEILEKIVKEKGGSSEPEPEEDIET